MIAIWTMWPSLGVGGSAGAAVVSRAVQALGAKPLTHFVSVTGTVNHAFVPETELVRLAHRAGALLRLQAPLQRKSTMVWHSATMAANGVTVRAESVILMQQGARTGETLLIVDQSGKGLGAAEDMGRLIDLLAPLNLSYRMSSVDVAEISGRLSNKIMGHLITRMKKNIGGQVVEPLKTKQLVAIAWRVPDVQPQVAVAGKVMNLQVAFSYDSYHGWTQVTVGSPLITIPY